VPVLVAGGGFPVNQVTMNAIREYVAEMGLFDHARIYELSIIDLGELEMLEGLAGSGSGPIDLILQWRASDLGDLSLRNWLLRVFGPSSTQFRAERIQPRVDALFQSMIERLGFSD
jgi:hypothetical protein